MIVLVYRPTHLDAEINYLHPELYQLHGIAALTEDSLAPHLNPVESVIY